ncbi:hypothetical protein N0V90_003400 [Kalmusia sp. IMI 367209]|nr:hypothetical protein N0V90_003400 [Kalmusia sp. IMI 367209]
MSSITIESDSLDQLQSPEQVELLDAIDKLRNQGLGHYDISLPQLIVCGDQSSGKSSVLEGLTRLRFPTKDGLCTTFATELILRKRAVTEIHCSIIPGKDRSKAERDELAKFKRSFASREEFAFPSLLEQAREQMAFGTSSDRGPFFEDVMQIRYSGPDLPSLTIVDLPGIIQSQVEGERGVKLVRSLVKRYMADEKSIILAVVSARNDLENQGVLDYVKTHDPSAVRTMGIITKPDTLDVGSKSEARFVKLARNEVMSLKLGWHVVKNRNFGQSEQSDAERDESERQFFTTGVWTSLPRTNVAIDALRIKLSRVLLQHIRNELPSLSTAIHSAIYSAETELKALGSPRHEPQQQRNFLMEKAQKFQSLTLDALRGLYNEEFFDVASLDVIPPTRLRTQIQDLNLAFACAMYSKGHQYHIVDGQVSPSLGASSLATHNYDGLPNPIWIDLAKFLDERIGTQVRLSRPSGLPTLVNPWVIGAVFRQQAKPWEAIARQHLSDVYEAVQAYLEESLISMMDNETFHALMHEHVGPELESRRAQLDKKLTELLNPYQKQEPITYDPSFIIDLKQVRSKRYFESKNQFTFGASQKSSTPETQLLTESLDDFTNVDILNLMQIYYKKAISVFISNVTVLAIENCLITDLPSLLSPDLVLNMDEEKLHIIAAESDDIRTERTALKQKLADLEAGKRILSLQARKAGKGTRNAPRPQKAAAPTPTSQTQDYRPRTSTEQTASTNPANSVDNLASSFNNISVTSPPTTKDPGTTHLQRSPETPPKSPKSATKPSSPWVMRSSTVESLDED